MRRPGYIDDRRVVAPEFAKYIEHIEKKLRAAEAELGAAKRKILEIEPTDEQLEDVVWVLSEAGYIENMRNEEVPEIVEEIRKALDNCINIQ